jgi:hypothetical protein
VGRSERGWFCAPLAGLCALGAYWRLAGIDPPSLWLDDQWVALIARKMSLGQFVGTAPPIPIGFAVVEAGFARWLRDPEWPLQLFPVLCSVAQLPLIALLVLRVTKRSALALLAAALVLLDPIATTYAVTVKQYAGDGLATLVLLLVGLPLLRAWSQRRAFQTLAAGLVAVLFSLPSCFVSFPILNLAGLASLWRRRRTGEPRGSELVVVLAFDLALLFAYFFLFRHQSHEAMDAYWKRNFVPVDSLGAAWSFLSGRGWLGLRVSLPEALGPLVALAPVGLLHMSLTRSLRSAAALLALVFGGLLVASALRIYPVATGRTDLFLHPLIFVLICTGVHALTRHARLARLADAALCIAIVAALWHFGRPSGYPERNDAGIVRALHTEARPEDAVIVYPHGAFAVGYYSSWPLDFVPSAAYAHGFDVRILRPNTLSLPGYRDFTKRPRAYAPLIRRFLAGRPPRVLYAGTHLDPSAHRSIQRAIVGAGYALTERRDAPMAQLLVYVPRSLP